VALTRVILASGYYIGVRMPALMHSRQDLADARESLAYWEQRSRRLPRHALRRRREARTFAANWRTRVAAAERARYGPGLLGTVLMLFFERRLPEPARHAGRRMARHTARAFTAVLVTLTALAVVAAVLTVELLAAVLRALT
jgi:hypothetical protein